MMSATISSISSATMFRELNFGALSVFTDVVSIAFAHATTPLLTRKAKPSGFAGLHSTTRALDRSASYLSRMTLSACAGGPSTVTFALAPKTFFVELGHARSSGDGL